MRTALLLTLLTAWGLSGCSAEQGYLAAQGWQRNQCLQSPDKTQADRCLSNSNTPYDAYKRQTDAGQK